MDREPRDDHNVYNPVPDVMPKMKNIKIPDEVMTSTIEYACDIRFHQSFKLPPNPDIGRNAPIRVSYSDTGKLDSPLQERYISTGPRIGIASKIIVEKDNIATAEAPSNAFIPGSLPSEESVDAVTHEQGEAGASSNDVLKFNDGRKDECLDQPVVLFCGGMFGGRYQAMSTATLAEEYGIRLIIVDRPGIGGSEKVPLKQRLQTWLDTVPALLKHVGVKHVVLGSHSAGTIYLLNTILYHRSILDPRRPYVAIFGPWVSPVHSRVRCLSAVGMLPGLLIRTWHFWARLMFSSIGPMFQFSGMVLSSVSSSLTLPFQKAKKGETIAKQKQTVSDEEENLAWMKAGEAVVTKYIYAEDVQGGSQEAMLCLRKGTKLWGAWGDYDQLVAMLSTSETLWRGESTDSLHAEWPCPQTLKHRRDEPRKEEFPLKVHAFFADHDEMIGNKGEEWFDKCWSAPARGRHIKYESYVCPETDHNGVCDPDKGVFEAFFKAIKDPDGWNESSVMRPRRKYRETNGMPPDRKI